MRLLKAHRTSQVLYLLLFTLVFFFLSAGSVRVELCRGADPGWCGLAPPAGQKTNCSPAGEQQEDEERWNDEEETFTRNGGGGVACFLKENYIFKTEWRRITDGQRNTIYIYRELLVHRRLDCVTHESEVTSKTL